MTTYSIRIAIRVVNWYIKILSSKPEDISPEVAQGILAFQTVRDVMLKSCPKGSCDILPR